MEKSVARQKYERALNYVRKTYSELVTVIDDSCVSLYAVKDGEETLLFTICMTDIQVEEENK